MIRYCKDANDASSTEPRLSGAAYRKVFVAYRKVSNGQFERPVPAGAFVVQNELQAALQHIRGMF